MSDTKQLIEQIKEQIKILKQEIKNKEDILENLIHEIEDESLLDEIE